MLSLNCRRNSRVRLLMHRLECKGKRGQIDDHHDEAEAGAGHIITDGINAGSGGADENFNQNPVRRADDKFQGEGDRQRQPVAGQPGKQAPVDLLNAEQRIFRAANSKSGRSMPSASPVKSPAPRRRAG